MIYVLDLLVNNIHLFYPYLSKYLFISICIHNCIHAWIYAYIILYWSLDAYVRYDEEKRKQRS